MAQMNEEQKAAVRAVFARQVAVPRSVRVTDDLWKAAKDVAEKRGETVSDVITRGLTNYVRRYQ